jgi:hypothetical protein
MKRVSISDAIRHPDQLVLRDEALLRQSAMDFSYEPTLAVERIHGHTIAGFPVLDAGTDLHNLACHIAMMMGSGILIPGIPRTVNTSW